MAKIKVQLVKEKKKGFLKKIIWGIIALIGFLASLVTVIDFMSNNKGYISRFIAGVKNLIGTEEPVKPENKEEALKKVPELKAEPEKKEQPAQENQPDSSDIKDTTKPNI